MPRHREASGVARELLPPSPPTMFGNSSSPTPVSSIELDSQPRKRARKDTYSEQVVEGQTKLIAAVSILENAVKGGNSVQDSILREMQRANELRAKKVELLQQ